jgi:hypothetical protein
MPDVAVHTLLLAPLRILLPPTGSSVPTMIRIGRSTGTRASFSGCQKRWHPLITEYVMLFEKGLPQSGSLWNSRISSAPLVCHSDLSD